MGSVQGRLFPDLKLKALMEIEQPLRGTQYYLQPDVPWENRMRCVEQVVVQRLVRHELVDQKPLRALISLRGAVADELDQVRVVDDAQETDFGQPFLVSLNKNRRESDVAGLWSRQVMVPSN
jgi:uncharacterized protein YnzC (UPF0291/DUF896 family)